MGENAKDSTNSFNGVNIESNNAIKYTKLKLYVGYFLSRWGDRMWIFALSIILGSIGERNMMLTAISGFVNSITVLLFATLVGRWIDKTPRLKAAVVMLVANNFSVSASAAMLVVILWPSFSAKLPVDSNLTGDLTIEETSPSTSSHLIFNVLTAGCIGLCAISNLASCGAKICISKDWVVVLSGGNKSDLANMNAWMLRLDLTSMILSPLLVGQIMASFGHAYGCVYVTIWNLASFFVEYFLLTSVYYSCNELSKKKVKLALSDETKTLLDTPTRTQSAETCDECNIPVTSCVHCEDVRSILTNAFDNSTGTTINGKHKNGKLNGRVRKPSEVIHTLGKPVTVFLSGWDTYWHQIPFAYAGLALALLYLTVLGLDGITTVYIASQGLKENAVALARGVGALMGILGTIAFPIMCQKMGLSKTGIFSLGAQLSCNFLCALSIWLPGTSFDPFNYRPHLQNFSYLLEVESPSMSTLDSNFTALFSKNESVLSAETSLSSVRPLHSILVFLAGIVLARFGLWMADLTITQIMQEGIPDHQRGVVNGVQHSMNQFLNMVKDLLVIAMPEPRTFGVLILVSCLSVSCGFFSFIVYAVNAKHYRKQQQQQQQQQQKKEAVDHCRIKEEDNGIVVKKNVFTNAVSVKTQQQSDEISIV